MSRLILLFFSLMVALTTADAQEILIKGKVTDKASHETVPFVNILNKHKNTGTASNADGTFKILIDLGDTLWFSAIGYSGYSLLVTKQLQEVHIDIKLDQVSMELQPVKVFAYRDLASLKQAIINMDVPAETGAPTNLSLPPVQPGHNGSDMKIVGVNGAITGLINGLGLNKEHNELQKLKKFQDEESRRRQINLKFNEKIVRRWTNLEGEKLTDFMEFCKLSENFILSASEYELALAVHTCLDEFEKPE